MRPVHLEEATADPPSGGPTSHLCRPPGVAATFNWGLLTPPADKVSEEAQTPRRAQHVCAGQQRTLTHSGPASEPQYRSHSQPRNIQNHGSRLGNLTTTLITSPFGRNFQVGATLEPGLCGVEGQTGRTNTASVRVYIESLEHLAVPVSALDRPRNIQPQPPGC